MIRVVLAVLAVISCSSNDDPAGVVKSYRSAVWPVVDAVHTADRSSVPIEELKFARSMDQYVELDAAQLEALKKGPVLFAMPISSSEADTFNRCERILTIDASRLEELSLSGSEIKTRLSACKARYVVVIGPSGSGGGTQYASEDGTATMQLSSEGVLQVWEVATKKRIIAVQFPITASAPSEIAADYAVNAGRLESAGHTVFEKMLTLKPKPKS